MNAAAMRTPQRALSFGASRGQKAPMWKALFASLALLSAAASAGAQAPLPVALTGTERTQAIADASRRLDAIRMLSGRFEQLAPNGAITRGTFHLQRPGRLRFDYDKPSPLTIVSDGSVVSIQDRALRTIDRAPLRSTPLHFVLASSINLDRDLRVTQVVREGERLAIALKDRTGQSDGELTLIFSGANLSAWRVIDAAGQVTEVRLVDTRTPTKLDAKLFRMDDVRVPITRRPGG